MKYLLIALTFSFFSLPSEIGWRKLSWNDFKGTPDGHGTSMAFTKLDMQIERKGDRFYFKPVASFIPQKSFTTTKSDLALKHEQLHFDITELYARKITSAIKSLQGCKYEEYKKAFMIYDSLCILWNKEQDRYDLETNHSLNGEKQCEWESKINKQL